MFTPQLIRTLKEGYRFSHFKADVFAGLTVAIVALPLSMAIAIASGVSPEQGLYTAIIGGFLISFLGGSRYQIGGPAGAFIVLVHSLILKEGYAGLATATFLSGIMIFAFGLLGFGKWVQKIPHAVIVGFSSAIALVIFLSQIQELLGLKILHPQEGFFGQISAIYAALPSYNIYALALSGFGVCALFLMRMKWPSLPHFLIWIILATAITALLQLPVDTIASRYGKLKANLPFPILPDLSLRYVMHLLPQALPLALLGCIESLLSARIADKMTNTLHNSNSELLAQGLANMASVCFMGIPVTGTIARTATNIRALAVSPFSGIMHAIFVYLITLIFAPLLGALPLAALAAILTIVCWNMADKDEFMILLKGNKAQSVVLLATFIITVVFNLLLGIGVGVVLAYAFYMLQDEP